MPRGGGTLVAVHGCVCLSQQAIDAVGITWVQGDTDADTNRQLFVADRDSLPERPMDSPDDRVRRAALAQPGLHDNELVAAEPGEQVRCAHQAFEPAGDDA